MVTVLIEKGKFRICTRFSDSLFLNVIKVFFQCILKQPKKIFSFPQETYFNFLYCQEIDMLLCKILLDFVNIINKNSLFIQFYPTSDQIPRHSFPKLSHLIQQNHLILLSVVDCESPGMIIDGTEFENNGTTYDSSITYECNLGYNMMGSDTITCQSSGQWSGPIPTCYSKYFCDLTNQTLSKLLIWRKHVSEITREFAEVKSANGTM